MDDDPGYERICRRRNADRRNWYSAVASATAAPGSPGAHLSAFHRGSRPKESFIARVSASGQASWDAAGHVLRMRVSRLRAGKPLAGGLAGRLNPVPSFVLSGSEASLK